MLHVQWVNARLVIWWGDYKDSLEAKLMPAGHKVGILMVFIRGGTMLCLGVS